MKVNLLLDNSKGIRDGYLNLDPFAEPAQNDLRKRSSLKELKEIDDGEVEELVAMDIIDYYRPNEANELLALWCRKLKHGGLLIVGFTNLYSLTKMINNRAYNLEEANNFLHGTQDKPWRIRRSTLSADYVISILKSNGLQIKIQRLYAPKIIIKGLRP